MHSLLENFAEVLRIVTFQPGRARIQANQYKADRHLGTQGDGSRNQSCPRASRRFPPLHQGGVRE